MSDLTSPLAENVRAAAYDVAATRLAAVTDTTLDSAHRHLQDVRRDLDSLWAGWPTDPTGTLPSSNTLLNLVRDLAHVAALVQTAEAMSLEHARMNGYHPKAGA